jgi:glucosamine-6-phosphate deaminase
MHVLISEDYEAMSREAFRLLMASWSGAMEVGSSFVLGLATGSTPSRAPGEGLYGEIIRACRSGEISESWFRNTTTFNLDEYRGFPPEDTASFYHFMYARLHAYVPIPRRQIHILNGLAEDAEAECAAFEAAIADAGGIDLQILGIGANGHIGFSEPGSLAAKRGARTQCVELDEQTIRDNEAKFGAVSDRALTMGVGTIMEARRVILLANGAAKALAVAAAVLGPTSSWLPASWLQQHPDCTFIVDRAAAELLVRLSRTARDEAEGCWTVTSDAGLAHSVEMLSADAVYA